MNYTRIIVMTESPMLILYPVYSWIIPNGGASKDTLNGHDDDMLSRFFFFWKGHESSIQNSLKKYIWFSKQCSSRNHHFMKKWFQIFGHWYLNNSFFIIFACDRTDISTHSIMDYRLTSSRRHGALVEQTKFGRHWSGNENNLFFVKSIYFSGLFSPHQT